MRSTTARAGTDLRIAYVSKRPPSPSGVALYADAFVQVLEGVADVVSIDAPSIPEHAQRLRSAVRGVVAGLRCRQPIVHVELSGRALFEFFFALTTVLRPSATLVLTCHDAPSLVGPPMLFTILDRRGLRRFGMALSASLGRLLEGKLASSAALVIALTQAGAHELTRKLQRPVHHLPHVAPNVRPTTKEHIVFLPGYIGEAGCAAGVIRAISRASASWEVHVGAMANDVESQIASVAASASAGDRVTLLGFVGESTLLREYERASIVARVAPRRGGGNELAASGPLVTAIAAGCLVGTNDDRPGALELQQDGFVTVCSDLAQWVSEQLDTDHDALAAHRAARAEDHFGVRAVTRTYERLLRGAIDSRGTIAAAKNDAV